MLSLLVLFTAVAARAPNSLQLACNDKERAHQWIYGAQDAAFILHQTLLGGYGCDNEFVAGCYENVALLDATTCIDPNAERPCLTGCNLPAHINADQPCCGVEDALECGEAPHVDEQGRVCRTNRQWFWLGRGKLYNAMITYERAAVGEPVTFLEASEVACAAEAMLSAVLDSIGGDFYNDGSKYRHSSSGLTSLRFQSPQTGRQRVTAIVIQTYRSCPVRGQCPPYVLVGTWALFIADPPTDLAAGTHQLLWPISGTLAPFDHTELPHNAQCALAQAPAGAAAIRLPELGHLDFARVMQTFVRCDGLPRNGKVRDYRNLDAGRDTNTLVLIDDLWSAVNFRRDDPINPSAVSFAYIAHFASSIIYDETTQPADLSNALIVRTAAADVCHDQVGNLFDSFPVPLADMIAPGRSICIGGTARDQTCTERNACGAGLACVPRPGSDGAFCFDGTWWNSAMPCVVASTQCPYGECYGAVSGDTGAYPYARVWRENNCDDPELANSLCRDSKVLEWRAANNK